MKPMTKKIFDAFAEAFFISFLSGIILFIASIFLPDLVYIAVISVLFGAGGFIFTYMLAEKFGYFPKRS